MIIGPQSGSPSAWSWFSIRVEKVGVAPLGLGARAVRKCSLECHGFRRTASLRTTSNRTTSCRTTLCQKNFSAGAHRTVSRKTVSREQFLSNSRARRTTSRRTTSQQRLARTAKTNLESLQKVLVERLLLHLCVLARAHCRKGSLPRLCGERVLLMYIPESSLTQNCSQKNCLMKKCRRCYKQLSLLAILVLSGLIMKQNGVSSAQTTCLLMAAIDTWLTDSISLAHGNYGQKIFKMS